MRFYIQSIRPKVIKHNSWGRGPAVWPPKEKKEKKEKGSDDEGGAGAALFIGWSDNHFNNLRFNKSQNINDLSAAHVAVLFDLRESMQCRLLK